MPDGVKDGRRSRRRIRNQFKLKGASALPCLRSQTKTYPKYLRNRSRFSKLLVSGCRGYDWDVANANASRSAWMVSVQFYKAQTEKWSETRHESDFLLRNEIIMNWITTEKDFGLFTDSNVGNSSNWGSSCVKMMKVYVFGGPKIKWNNHDQIKYKAELT